MQIWSNFNETLIFDRIFFGQLFASDAEKSQRAEILWRMLTIVHEYAKIIPSCSPSHKIQLRNVSWQPAVMSSRLTSIKWSMKIGDIWWTILSLKNDSGINNLFKFINFKNVRGCSLKKNLEKIRRNLKKSQKNLKIRKNPKKSQKIRRNLKIPKKFKNPKNSLKNIKKSEEIWKIPKNPKNLKNPKKFEKSEKIQ